MSKRISHALWNVTCLALVLVYSATNGASKLHFALSFGITVLFALAARFCSARFKGSLAEIIDVTSLCVASLLVLFGCISEFLLFMVVADSFSALVRVMRSVEHWAEFKTLVIIAMVSPLLTGMHIEHLLTYFLGFYMLTRLSFVSISSRRTSTLPTTTEIP